MASSYQQYLPFHTKLLKSRAELGASEASLPAFTVHVYHPASSIVLGPRQLTVQCAEAFQNLHDSASLFCTSNANI